MVKKKEGKDGPHLSNIALNDNIGHSFICHCYHINGTGDLDFDLLFCIFKVNPFLASFKYGMYIG